MGVRSAMPLLRRHKAQLAVTVAATVLLSQPAFAIDVGTEADLRAAIETARTTPNTEIVLTASITLSQDLPALQGTGTVIRSAAGNKYAIDGDGKYRGLFVYSGSVTVQNITITNAVAQGGKGGNGTNYGGGGGAGLGGALFVNARATVTVSNVSLDGNAAIGGAGGRAVETSTPTIPAGAAALAAMVAMASRLIGVAAAASDAVRQAAAEGTELRGLSPARPVPAAEAEPAPPLGVATAAGVAKGATAVVVAASAVRTA